ncbi:MAG: aminomethyl-transferring glycine dehydrogenase subunit GcvPA [Candidatus Omnitrophica bacterium]|jgi:glycine dehydrogenase subunit 1|nr:aminomethyl-transferring glycine dehydrogenase subunit GcvPA [Candidatus Omnitrophota bacterium]
MPYILNTENDIKEMLRVVGVASLDDLYKHLPSQIRLKNELNISSGLSEYELKQFVTSLAAKNKTINSFNSFLGAGLYDHYIPSALKPLISRAEFLTAYTPYQAECSQGILQAIYEYQSYICLLTGMDVSNASLFDGASSLAECVLMSLRITKRNKVVLSSSINPEYKKTLYTYLSGFNFKIQEIDFDTEGFTDTTALKSVIDENTACFALQSPNFFGLIEDTEKFSSLVKEKGILTILVTNPLSLSLLKEPAYQGVDIVCGDGQVLGGSLSLGGPSFGFVATKNEYLRQLPGRLVGKTVDRENKIAYCLTLQAREQHIKREKATSNICSNQSLNAIQSAIYLSLMGKDGIRKCAVYSLNLSHYLYGKLAEIKGVKLNFSQHFFNEFIWQIDDAKSVLKKLYKKKIIAGLGVGSFYPKLKNGILSCCTEIKAKEQIDEFIEVLKGI